jgi:hypothetical protein
MKIVMVDSAGKKAKFVKFVEDELNKLDFSTEIKLSIEKTKEIR